MAEITQVETYSFTPGDLNVAARRPGISAFVRTRNGADFIAAAIRSHAPHVDEIVAVHNQCTDDTEAILARLQDELGPDKLKLYHYRPRVYPPGSDQHIAEPPASPHSVVAYSNFALARTTRTIAFKVDDDHIALEGGFARLAQRARQDLPAGRMDCFSGLNLARDETGRVGILASTPFGGTGDHGFFTVTPDTYFDFDRRFETFRTQRLKRVFTGFAYWHTKYLKAGQGFANYEIEAGTNRRFARKQRDFERRRQVVSLAALSASMPRLKAQLMRHLPHDKKALIAERALAMAAGAVTDADLAAFLRDHGLGEPVGA